MGSGGTEWEANDTLSVARLNQKTLHVGASEPATTYAGMLWFDTDDGRFYKRNKDNDAWIEIPDNSVNFVPTGIEFGSATQEYDVSGTTWVSAVAGGTLGGIPDETSAGHHLADCITAITTSRDGEFLNVRELTGAASATNPLTVQFLFSGVTDFDTIKVRSMYHGSPSHYMQIQLWNYGTSAWDVFADFSDETEFITRSIIVFNAASYIDSGVVKLQFIHLSSGIATHYIEFDYVALGTGSGGGGIVPASTVTYNGAGIFAATTNVQSTLDLINATYLDQAVKQASSPTFANVSLGTGKLNLGTADRHYITDISATEIGTDRDFNIGADALVGTPAAHNTILGLLAAAGGGVYYSGSITVNGTSGLMSITSTHSLLLDVTGTVQTACSLTSDTADTDDLGSTTKEWKNIYVGDAGRIYLGLGQDTSIYRSGANALGIIASSGVTLSAGLTVGSAIVSDTADTDDLGSTSKEWKNLYIGTGYIYLGTGQDVNLYRSDANLLKTDDTMHVSGNLYVGASGTGLIYIGNDGANWDTNLYRDGANQLKTDDFFSAQNVKSYGTYSGLIFIDRTSSREWQWYGTGDVAYLHNGTDNILEVSTGGNIKAYAAIRGTYITDNLANVKTNLQTAGGYTDLCHVCYFDGSWHNLTAGTKATILLQDDSGILYYYCTDTAGGVDFVQKFQVDASGNCWIQSNCSADSYTERSSFYEGDALTELKKIVGEKGKLNHDSLPDFIKRVVKRKANMDDDKIEEVIEKDLGATISMLTTAVIQLSKEIDTIKLNLNKP